MVKTLFLVCHWLSAFLFSFPEKAGYHDGFMIGLWYGRMVSSEGEDFLNI
jgi:hypothetical protein